MVEELKDGPYEKYFWDGVLEEKGVVVNGEVNVHEKYYDEGQINIETKYLEDNSTETSYFYKNGKLMYFLKNGVQGKFIEYFPNGQIKERSFSVNGIYDGLFERYFSNGILRERVNYVSGKKVGLCERYEKMMNMNIYI